MKKTLFTLLCCLTVIALLGVTLTLTLMNPQFKPGKIMRLMQEGRRAMSETNYAAAVDCFRLVLYLKDTKIEAYLRLADIYVMEEDPEEALYYIEQGLQVKPMNEDLLEARDRLLTMIAVLYPEETDPDDAFIPDETDDPDSPDDPDATIDPDAAVDPDAAMDPHATVDPDAAIDPDATAEPDAAASPDAARDSETTAGPDTVPADETGGEEEDAA